MLEQITIGVRHDYDPSLHNGLKSQLQDDFKYIEARGISGDTAAWIVISTSLTQITPHILDFIKFIISQKKVKSVQIGKMKVENPDPETLDIIRTQLEGSAKGDHHE